MIRFISIIFLFVMLALGCKSKIKETEDDVYSRHLQKHVKLTIFNTITIAGCSLGGLSAFDIGWEHADRINNVGVFSGSFWYRDKDAEAKDYSDDKDRIMLNKITSSRKKPHLQFWFYAGDDEEKSDRDNDGITDV